MNINLVELQWISLTSTLSTLVAFSILRPETLSAKKREYLLECAQKFSSLYSSLKKSAIFDSATPAGSSLREDINRLDTMCQAVFKIQDSENGDFETLDGFKIQLMKNRGGPFHSGVTIFPVGCFVCDEIGKMVAQSRQDQLLEKEIACACEFARGLKTIDKDTIMKEKEFSIPNQNKFADMVAKQQALKANGSDHMKTKMVDNIDVIESRIVQLKDALTSAVSSKYGDDIMEMFNYLKLLKTGLNDQQAARCCQLLTNISNFQPWQKVPLPKLLGKSWATELETISGSVAKFGKLLMAAFPKLLSLGQGDSEDSLLMCKEITETYACLQDQDCLHGLKVLWGPEKDPAIEAVLGSIETAVSSWLLKTCSTFEAFICELMEPEFDVNKVMTTAVVGIVDEEVIPSKVGNDHVVVDFNGIFAAFVKHKQDQTLDVTFSKGEEKKCKLPSRFLCQAGSLLEIVKYVHFFEQKIVASQKQPKFEALVADDFDRIKKKTATDKVSSKVDVLHSFTPHFVKLSKAWSRFIDMTKTLNEAGLESGIEECYNKMVKRVGDNLALVLEECDREIDDVQNMIQGLFNKILANHGLPAIFQAEKLEKNSISSLCGDPSCQLLAHAGNKAGMHMKLGFGWANSCSIWV